jgi:Leucine-rich repeat (LRR) protein
MLLGTYISTSIESIDISNNSITSVPFWLGNCAKLGYLDLGSNALNGSLPSPLRNLTSLTWLDLSQNTFESVPLWLGGLEGLLYLNLSWNHVNHIEGSLTTIIGNMCHLLSLDFSGNRLQGDALVGNLQSGCIGYDLEELDLTNNNFNDQLPTWLRQLENLVILTLHSSFFHGPIPNFWENCQTWNI